MKSFLKILPKKLTRMCLSSYKNFNLIINNFFDLDMIKHSAFNLKRMRGLLSNGGDSLIPLVKNQADMDFFASLNLPKEHLSSSEIYIFNALVRLFSLKHASDAIPEIVESGKMLAIRDLEQQGVQGARHTHHTQGVDRSLYFVFGIGNHKTPSFLGGASHTITVDLDTLSKTDPLTLKRLWVSGHLTEYQCQNSYSVRLGNVNFTMSHYKDNTKLYKFTYDTGQCLEWKLAYNDEIFAGQDVLPGIALYFLVMLRLLGGDNNPLVQKLHETATNEDAEQLESLLENMFTHMFPGWIYPEAKIISELDINNKAVSISENSNDRHGESIAYKALSQAIKSDNYLLLLNLLERNDIKRNCPDIFKEVFSKIKDPTRRNMYLIALINYGINPGLYHETIFECIIKEHTAEDLDFMLSHYSPNSEEPLIKSVVHPNLKTNKDHDLIGVACRYDYSGKMLEVLKKHGGDFNTFGYSYLCSAVYLRPINLNAITFLANQGVIAYDKESYNQSPLMLAAQEGNLMVVRLLVEEMRAVIDQPLKTQSINYIGGGAIYDSPLNGKTALHFAAENGHEDVVAYLIEQGANPTLKLNDKRGSRPVDLVSPKAGNLKRMLNRYIESYEAKENSTAMEVEVPMDHSHNQPHDMRKQKVAVLLTGQRENGKPYVVLGKRKQQPNKTGSNYYCFPGGSADDSDSSLQEAALRELFEETAINVSKIPGAKITAFPGFSGFSNPEHQSTTFFMVNVGKHPIQVHACDDLVEVNSFTLDKLEYSPSSAPASQMKLNNTPVLGSNALLIKYALLLGQHKLPKKELKTVFKQLQIEEEGYAKLLKVLAQCGRDPAKLQPNTKHWNKLKSLLENGAHLASMDMKETSISLEVLQLNPIEGSSLLASYGVDFNDYKEAGMFRLGGERYNGSPLLYAVATNDIDFVQHLMSLGAKFNAGYSQRMLAICAERNCQEMLDFILDQGVDGNRSYDYKSSPCDVRIYPIIAMAIKHDNLDLAAHLIQRGTIFLNRERSPESRSTVLMTAIEHDKKEAAMHLLGTSRLDLQASHPEREYSEEEVSALDLARKKKWEDVVSIIHFLNHYKDMNSYLEKQNLPQMSFFKHTVDEKGLPTIHFISTNETKIRQLSKRFFNATVHQDGNNYYLRLGKYRLSQLVKSNSVASFLLKYAKHSNLFTVKPAHYRDLEQQLVQNKLTEITVDHLAQGTHFANLENKGFYSQLIRENVSLRKVVFNLDHEDQNCLNWLINSVQGHDRVEEVVFENQPLSVQSLSLESQIKLLGSFKRLSKVSCNQMSLESIKALIIYLNTARSLEQEKTSKPLTLIIQGGYEFEQYEELLILLQNIGWRYDIDFSDAPAEIQEQLDKLILQNQTHYLSQDKALVGSVNQRLTSAKLSFRSSDENMEINHLLLKVSLLNKKVKNLLIRGDFDEMDILRICNFIEKSHHLQSITINICSLYLVKILTAIENSPSQLINIGLSTNTIGGHDLKVDELSALMRVLKKHPVDVLSLDFININVPKDLIVAFGKLIAKKQTLRLLGLSFVYMADKDAYDMFIGKLVQSTSLLTVVLENYRSKPEMELINKMSVDNNQELQTDTVVQMELEEKPRDTINSHDYTEMEFDAPPQNHEELDSIMPELWSQFIIPRLDDRSLVNASLGCRFFNQITSDRLGQLRAARGPRDYSQAVINNPCDTINQLFRANEEMHHLTFLNSNTFAVVAYKKIHIIQFKPSEQGGYEFTPYREISVASDGIKTDSLKNKLIKLSNNRLVIADDKKACVYDWITGTRLSDPAINGNTISRLAQTTDGYMILTVLSYKKFQLTHYDIESKTINSIEFSYSGIIHRVDMDREGNFLIEVYESNDNLLYCINPEGNLCFKQSFVHNDPYGRMHSLVEHPSLFVFTNDFTTDTQKYIDIYKRNESHCPELLIHLPLEGRFNNFVLLQNGRFFAWQEESKDRSRQLKIIDLENKKIIHNSTISPPPNSFKYTIPTNIISLPNGDIISIEINRSIDHYQASTFCFPPCLRLSIDLQSNNTCRSEDSIEDNSRAEKKKHTTKRPFFTQLYQIDSTDQMELDETPHSTEKSESNAQDLMEFENELDDFIDSQDKTESKGNCVLQ